ncbi:MAG: FdtA/QdtA family cupin domain-containing protein [Cytophagia bacterium]|nr:FdtA/QdtA family cupin domain-containing protein [Cytophagia bacterium]
MKKPQLYEFTAKSDSRGNLNFLEELKDVPFEVKRVYWLTQVPEQQVRGGHAHKTGEQVIICTQGVVEVVLEDQKGMVMSYTLDDPSKGLYIPPLWWGRMLFKGSAMLLGLASDEFSEEDYIRNKPDFHEPI